jgi:hypothetical protein
MNWKTLVGINWTRLAVSAGAVVALSLGLTWLFASIVDNNLVMTQRDLATARQALATTRDQIAASRVEFQQQQARQQADFQRKQADIQNQLAQEQSDAQNQIAATQNQLTTARTQLTQVQQVLSTTPSIIFLDNKSSGLTYFYVDGRVMCENRCVIALQGGTNVHHLEAHTYYGSLSNPPIETPTYFSFPSGTIMEYFACGQLGMPRSNCGLFALIGNQVVAQ